tara:strand:- start:5009 stop:5176 length:168 start_codon:yes stop_codon:yes gene_type:complete
MIKLLVNQSDIKFIYLINVIYVLFSANKLWDNRAAYYKKIAFILQNMGLQNERTD